MMRNRGPFAEEEEPIRHRESADDAGKQVWRRCYSGGTRRRAVRPPQVGSLDTFGVQGDAGEEDETVEEREFRGRRGCGSGILVDDLDGSGGGAVAPPRLTSGGAAVGREVERPIDDGEGPRIGRAGSRAEIGKKRSPGRRAVALPQLDAMDAVVRGEHQCTVEHHPALRRGRERGGIDVLEESRLRRRRTSDHDHQRRGDEHPETGKRPTQRTHRAAYRMVPEHGPSSSSSLRQVSKGSRTRWRLP
jgi:hypothetical protein